MTQHTEASKELVQPNATDRSADDANNYWFEEIIVNNHAVFLSNA